MTLFYLAQTQLGTSKKVQIRELKQQQEDLSKDIELLQVQGADLKSIREIKEKASRLNMLPNPDF